MTSRDHEYTLKIAEHALGKIKALSLPADPPAYELWYAYAARRLPALNHRINSILDANGTLSVDELDGIYDEFLLSPTGVKRIGTRLSGEIDRVVEMLDELILSTGESRGDCSDASNQLAVSTDQPAVRAIADALIRSLRSVELKYAALEQRLSVSKREMDLLQQSMAALSVEANADPVTGLINRRGFERELEQAILYADRNGQPLSLMMIDIDHFKSFNDRFGHLMGDSVLSLVGMVLKKSIKGQDTAARYGGEEFSVVLPNTNLDNATIVAEQIRGKIMNRELQTRGTGQGLGKITVSIGVAEYRQGERLHSLIERADACLYEAKGDGRNCTRCDTRDRDLAPTLNSGVYVRNRASR
jgi:diguanylate cyclase